MDKTTLSATVTVLVTGTSGAISVLSSDSTVATAVLSGDTITISSVNDKTGNVTVTVSAAEDANHLAPEAKTIAVAAKFVTIYGVEWDGTSTTKWTRTDASANFADPVPYVTGATEYGSPFDNLMPWAGMTVSERTGGTMVAIPKFWYNLTQLENNGLKIQIADGPVEGFYPSPAHMDRGDGKGERDMVFIGRYHCNSNYKSITGSWPIFNTRAGARSKIINLNDSGTYLFDFAAYMTIQMLYLVEFADWNSQATIGKSWFASQWQFGNNAQKCGRTDSMPYHTGITATTKDGKGAIQYRNIEDLWGNFDYWIDGTLATGTLYVSTTPSMYAEERNESYTFVAGYSNGGLAKVVNVFNLENCKIFVPIESGGSNSTYVCDEFWYGNNTGVVGGGGGYLTGGSYNGTPVSYNPYEYGLFRLYCRAKESKATSMIMELP